MAVIEKDPPIQLEVSDLSISFGGIRALNDVSLAVKKGEIYSIIGPNGAGKTTLFNCISGIYHPQEGSIRFEGAQIRLQKPHKIAQMGIARKRYRLLTMQLATRKMNGPFSFKKPAIMMM